MRFVAEPLDGGRGDGYRVTASAVSTDGDPPFAPRGCIAQAWSVAETLRAWLEIGGGRAASRVSVY